MNDIKNFLSQWRERTGRPALRHVTSHLTQTGLLIVGSFLAAFGYAVFQVPYNMAAGGVGGISLIINNYTGWPVGTLYLLLNIPLLIWAFRPLGGWPFVLRTLLAAALFAGFTDLLTFVMPTLLDPFPPADNVLLSAVYGGIMGGIGAGLVYRAGSSMGGTGLVGRVIQQKTGRPLSQIYFYTDGGILLVMGLVFGWETTLYGLLILFINGMATDYTLEGPSTTRVATVVTNYPQTMAAALMRALGRGVSYWEVTGGYTGQTRYMVTCTIQRPQVNDLRRAVAEADPHAFLTIGLSHRAMGQGFMPLRQEE